MTDTAKEKIKTGVVELAGVRFGKATEHIVWILLSIWFFLQVLPTFESADSHFEGPISWYGSLWIEVGGCLVTPSQIPRAVYGLPLKLPRLSGC